MSGLAALVARFWQWIDDRDIDKHSLLVLVAAGTWQISVWAMHYVDAHPDDAGTDVGLKVGAVLLAWNIIATPVVKRWFEARK